MTAYRFMEREKGNNAVRTMCRVLGVSRSGYDAWQGREPSLRTRHDVELPEQTVASHAKSRQTYGVLRIHADLRAAGTSCSKKRVPRLMKAAGLVGCHRRRHIVTTQREPSRPPAPDPVSSSFAATAPNRISVADITYVPTWSGFVYLAVVLDTILWALNRRSLLVIIANSVRRHRARDLAEWEALRAPPFFGDRAGAPDIAAGIG